MAKGKGMQLDNRTLDLKVSVERDKDGLISSGLAVGGTLSQNQALILHAHKGEMKESPATGVGLSDSIGDDGLTGWRREIALQLEADGMKVRGIQMTTEKLTIDAYYSEK